MKSSLMFFALVAAVLMLGYAGFAHHGTNASYDPSRTIVVTGIVTLVAILLFASMALPQGRGQRGGGQRGAAQESASATAALPFGPRDLSGIWLGRNRVLAMSEDPPPRTSWGDAKFNSYKPSYG